MITVQLLGGASLRSGDTPVGGPPAQRHRIALLTLIVASWPQPLSRDRAMALLWPERDGTSARRLLNLAVHVLRAALGDNAIVSTGDGLLLDPSHVTCDLQELRTAIAADVGERVVHLYTGPLLDGFHLSESVEFGYWLDEQRQDLAHAYAAALRILAEHQMASGDTQGAVRTGRKLVAADPHSARHALVLMRALDAADDRAAAIQHASEHAQRLRADLGLGPDEQVVALAGQLRTGAAKGGARTSLGTARPPSVAVLPFVNLSGDEEHERFAEGITEDVIAHLSKIRALKVISHTSVVSFKSRQHSSKDIGSMLGVSTLLDGSIRCIGDRLRIVAKLIDVETEQNLWAEIYDRQLTDIFSIQTDVALHIAAALRAELSLDEQARVRTEPTRDIHAYQLFLQALQWFIRYDLEALLRSIEYFDRAIARDPTFALAYAYLATAHTQLAEHGAVPPDQAYDRAEQAVARALRLDPLLGAAHCTSAHLGAVRGFDWAGAESSFRRALELSPSDAHAHNLYGRFCAALGRYDEAIALHRRARELDPLVHRMDGVTALLRAGRYDEAVADAESAAELDPSHGRTRATLGWAYFLSGRQADGLAQLEYAVALAPDDALWLAQLGEAYGIAGQLAKARAILLRLECRARETYVSPYLFAYVNTGLGDYDRAMDCLERAVASRTGPVYSIRGSFLFAPLSHHPRFQALLRTMKLNPATPSVTPSG